MQLPSSSHKKWQVRLWPPEAVIQHSLQLYETVSFCLNALTKLMKKKSKIDFLQLQYHTIDSYEKHKVSCCYNMLTFHKITWRKWTLRQIWTLVTCTVKLLVSIFHISSRVFTTVSLSPEPRLSQPFLELAASRDWNGDTVLHSTKKKKKHSSTKGKSSLVL